MYMGDYGSAHEQIGYATADNITGPYTKYALNPCLPFGPPGSYDAGTVADPWVYEYYGVYYISKGWGGVDIGPLKEIGVPISAYNTDSQRYYDIHHCAFDTFENVHFREMQIGSANIASLIYLIDKYGIESMRD